MTAMARMGNPRDDSDDPPGHGGGKHGGFSTRFSLPFFLPSTLTILPSTQAMVKFRVILLLSIRSCTEQVDLAATNSVQEFLQVNVHLA